MTIRVEILERGFVDKCLSYKERQQCLTHFRATEDLPIVAPMSDKWTNRSVVECGAASGKGRGATSTASKSSLEADEEG